MSASSEANEDALLAKIDQLEAERDTALTDHYDTIGRLRIEITRLRSIIRVNGLRAGHSHAEIDRVLDGGEA